MKVVINCSRKESDLLKQVKALVGKKNVSVQYEKSQRQLKAEAELLDASFYEAFKNNLDAYQPPVSDTAQKLAADALGRVPRYQARKALHKAHQKLVPSTS